MKYLKIFTFTAALGAVIMSCEKKATYPDVPVITYNNFYCDSACLRINFTDGNGDIGYPSQQEGVKPNLYANVLAYVYKTKAYDSVVQFSYNIPYITPTGSDKALNGIIQVNFEGLLNEWVVQDSVGLSKIADFTNLEFQVWIIDRAGNKSNVLITPPVSYPCK